MMKMSEHEWDMCIDRVTRLLKCMKLVKMEVWNEFFDYAYFKGTWG